MYWTNLSDIRMAIVLGSKEDWCFPSLMHINTPGLIKLRLLAHGQRRISGEWWRQSGQTRLVPI